MCTFAAQPLLKLNPNQTMNRILPTCIVAISVLASQAQTTTIGSANRKAQPQKINDAVGDHRDPSHQPAPAGEARTVPFFTEDFSGGAVPANWTNIDELTPSGTPVVEFVWSNVPADVSVAALGYQPSSIFNSTTGLNGYLWCNSDRGLTAAPGFDHLTHLTTDALDCTGQPTVLLSFQSLIGVFDYDAATNVKVRVSTDLTNWTDFTPFPCLVTGAAAPPCVRWSANPETVELNISSVAANQPQIYVQWEWLGGWEYFWALDDVTLSPVPDYERQLLFSLVSHAGSGFEYGRIPRGQLLPEFILGGQVRNRGLNAQTNLTLTAQVIAPGGADSFNATETFATVASDDTAAMEQATTLPTDLAEGTYTVNFSVTSDQDAQEEDLTDDTDTREFALDDGLYSLDGIGVYASEQLTSTGTNSFPNNTDDIFLFTLYQIENNFSVDGIQVLLANGSTAGGLVQVSLHDTANVFANDPDSPLASSLDYEVTQADVDAGMLNVSFDSPWVLEPGGWYAAIKLNGNTGEDTLRVIDDVTVPQPNDGSLIFLPNETTPGGATGTFGNGNAFAIRLMGETVSGIADNKELSGVNMFPNPTSGIVNITFAKVGAYSVQVMNMLGETVATVRMNGNGTMDLGGFAAGIYSVRVSDGVKTTVQRVTLN